MGEETKRGMPLVICQVGSGVLSLLSIAAFIAAAFGVATVLLYATQRGRETPIGEAFGFIFGVAIMLAMLGLVGLVWWMTRQELYAKCLRFWHPEMAPPKKVACPECSGCELCAGEREVDEGATLAEEPDDLWVDAAGALWLGPLDVAGSNFHYAKLSGFEGAEGGGLKPSWILARSDADPTWLPFDYGTDTPRTEILS